MYSHIHSTYVSVLGLQQVSTLWNIAKKRITMQVWRTNLAGIMEYHYFHTNTQGLQKTQHVCSHWRQDISNISTHNIHYAIYRLCGLAHCKAWLDCSYLPSMKNSHEGKTTDRYLDRAVVKKDNASTSFKYRDWTANGMNLQSFLVIVMDQLETRHKMHCRHIPEFYRFVY